MIYNPNTALFNLNPSNIIGRVSNNFSSHIVTKLLETIIFNTIKNIGDTPSRSIVTPHTIRIEKEQSTIKFFSGYGIYTTTPRKSSCKINDLLIRTKSRLHGSDNQPVEGNGGIQIGSDCCRQI